MKQFKLPSLNKNKKSSKKKSTKITMQSLNKWNKTMAALHAVQGIAILILSNSVAWPVVTNFLSLDTLATKISGQPVLADASREIFTINLGYMVAAFFFISAIAHLLVATRYRKTYEANLKKGINKARWIEYAFSASLMMVTIGLLSGINDLSSMIMIFSLVLIMNLMGLTMEIYNSGKSSVDWLTYWIGSFAGIIPWVVFGIYVWGANFYGTGNIPTFVYWIYLSIFIFFNSFAVNMYLQYTKKGKWSNYLYGERAYMILSLVAKTALAWQVFAGTLRP
ncbi:heliorhodopsin HeR [Candidatus Saccharibacteria bacterium]|nr:heliorhodopsin HeR [Candidatus Saccharibacteria bacterium]